MKFDGNGKIGRDLNEIQGAITRQNWYRKLLVSDDVSAIKFPFKIPEINSPVHQNIPHLILTRTIRNKYYLYLAT